MFSTRLNSINNENGAGGPNPFRNTALKKVTWVSLLECSSEPLFGQWKLLEEEGDERMENSDLIPVLHLLHKGSRDQKIK